MMFVILSFFWFLREIKAILFWLYLWQLKEYHIGRFIDHFRTEKGKNLILNKIFGLKIILLVSYFIFPLILIWGLWILYVLEFLKTFKDFFEKKLRTPVLTKKTIFLISIALVIEVSFLFFLLQSIWHIKSWEILFLPWFTFWLLIFDLLTPVIVSVIVLIFQPLAVLGRNQIINQAKRKRESFKDLLVIGITGSYGKTSTKEFLYTILSENFGENKVLKTKEHQNSEVGVSQCILEDLKPEHQIFIVEMGAYNRGGIKLLSDIAKPKIGILTGINEQHMATFGSQGNIIKAKYELIEGLPEDGLAIFNGNNKYCRELYKKTNIKKKICPEDIFARNIQVEKEFISFKVFSRDGNTAYFKVNVLGAQNIDNILMAACCAKELGMNLKEISITCQKIKSGQGGMKLIKLKDGLDIIDSTYSANPDGVIAHLEYLKIWPGKKIIVMPCLIELGEASVGVHRRIGEKIGQVCNLAVIVTKERLQDVKGGAMKTGMSEENIVFMENQNEIFDKVKSFSKTGDTVLLEGRISKEIIQLLK